MAFNINLPQSFNAADYFVDRNIREGRADKLAFICEDRKLTYGQIQAGMNRIGNGLRSLGVRMEERVALLLLDTEFYPQGLFRGYQDWCRKMGPDRSWSFGGSMLCVYHAVSPNYPDHGLIFSHLFT